MDDKKQTASLFDCIYRAWVYDTPLSDEVLPLVKQLIADERRAAAEAMRERCATFVEKWHISKGGYGELAYQLRELPLDTPDDGRE